MHIRQDKRPPTCLACVAGAVAEADLARRHLGLFLRGLRGWRRPRRTRAGPPRAHRAHAGHRLADEVICPCGGPRGTRGGCPVAERFL